MTQGVFFRENILDVRLFVVLGYFRWGFGLDHSIGSLVHYHRGIEWNYKSWVKD